MDIKEIYDAMKRARLVATKDVFSSDWLGMHWSYYKVMGERTTVGPLMTLWKRLTVCGEQDLARMVFKLVDERADQGTGVPRDERRRKALAKRGGVRLCAATIPRLVTEDAP